ncbi:TetR/AcrR family transcriptional regulator [Tepidimonas charontis]|uniref:TetR/AcrR family transcriptional regulator n=1 Tax=Tepidimonas charontis TaxID=2267262 RepID=UPI001F3E315C|nr:TetR/AcrR family transcriptional regulator [Tepidimonas charontis]
MAAARALIRAGGPAAVTMERVAQHAGVSKVTLYRRYANRTALLEAVVRQRAQRLCRALRAPPVSDADVRARLYAFVEALLAFLCGSEHRQFLRALSGVPQSPADVQRIWQLGPATAHAALAAFLRAAHAQQQLHCPDADAAAEQLLGLAMGLDLVRSLYRVPLARQRRVHRRAHAQQVVDGFLRAYAGGFTAAAVASPGPSAPAG